LKIRLTQGQRFRAPKLLPERLQKKSTRHNLNIRVTTMHTTTDDADALLTRKQVAQKLTASGFIISAPTLATMVSRGGGPPYQRFGPRALYRWADALAWAQGRLSAPRRSSSEGDCILTGLP
jgi:hypothetical protein